jgi:hypothetical protein
VPSFATADTLDAGALVDSFQAGRDRVVEHHTYNVSGIRMDEVVRELKVMEHRDRLLHGRW